MRLAIACLGLVLTTAAYAHQPATVADALTVERLRLDPPHADAAALITQAADRFTTYHPLAKSPAEVRRLYRAFKAYSDGVLERARWRLDAAHDRSRPRGGRKT